VHDDVRSSLPSPAVLPSSVALCAVPSVACTHASLVGSVTDYRPHAHDTERIVVDASHTPAKKSW
jgi:hypothetical protein